MGASKTQVMNLLEMRFDYQSARNVLVNWRKAAGIKDDIVGRPIRKRPDIGGLQGNHNPFVRPLGNDVMALADLAGRGAVVSADIQFKGSAVLIIIRIIIIIISEIANRMKIILEIIWELIIIITIK